MNATMERSAAKPTPRWPAAASRSALSDVERQILGIVAKHHKRFGGDFEELMSDAHLGFAEALRTFDLAKGYRFTTWCQTVIQYKLLDRFSKRKPPLPCDETDTGTVADPHPRHFDLRKFAGELTGDALIVLRLAFEARGGPDTRRDAVARWLKETGWTFARIAAAFDKVAEVLGIDGFVHRPEREDE